MFKIDIVKRAVDTILNKKHKNIITPERFNTLVTVAQLNVFSYLVDLYRIYRKKSSYRDRSLNLSIDAIKSEINGFYGKTQLIKSGDVYLFPSEDKDNNVREYLFHEKNALIDKTPSTSTGTIDIVLPDIANFLEGSYIDVNNAYNLVAVELNNGFEIIPDGEYEPDFYYYGRPFTPKWTYQYAQSTAVFNSSDDQFQDLELSAIFLPNIINEVCAQLGITIGKTDVTQILQNEQGQEHQENMM